MVVERLRFKDENGNAYPDWQHHKLSSHGEGYSGISGLDKNYFNTNKDNAIYITYMDVFSKYVISDPSGTFLNVNENQNIVKYGDVLFTTSSETREEVGIASLYLGDKPTYLNSFCFGWSSNWERNHYFMSYLFNSTPIRRKIIKLGQGSTRFNISKNKLLNLPLNIPTIKEQEKIGNFLSLFDRLILKIETKIGLLKELKKGYLQQMFPAKGETVPKIRFSGFDRDWEYYKLSDYGEGYTGISGLNNNYFNTDKDNAIYITYMDVFSKNVITNPSGTFLKENENQNIVKYGDILFTTSSETRKEVGIASLYLGEKPTYLNSFCFGWHSNWDRNHYFISYLFNSKPIRRKIIKLGQGSTRFNISKNKLLNLPLNFPIIKEQEKIGNFFRSLDSMIEKQEKEFNTIERLKKGYMQRLFV